ncbi:hypothetical protein D3C81_1407380 [compost metagenome]
MTVQLAAICIGAGGGARGELVQVELITLAVEIQVDGEGTQCDDIDRPPGHAAAIDLYLVKLEFDRQAYAVRQFGRFLALIDLADDAQLAYLQQRDAYLSGQQRG